MTKSLKIEKAKENNLKNISLEIPHDEFVVITGLSGSGKSSLAFDTVYAEGQRRYIETFSPYTRQFFDKVKKPEVDRMSGVRPAIAIQQRTRITNSRSTVGSLTNCNEYLKIIWSNLAVPNCPECGSELIRWTPSTASLKLEELCSEFPDDTFLIGAEIKEEKNIESTIQNLKEVGISRGVDPKTEEIKPLSEIKSFPLTVIFERISKRNFKKSRAQEAIEQGMVLGKNTAVIIHQRELKKSERFYFSSDFKCNNDCSVVVTKPRPALFSFNHPYGACSQCKGFGRILTIDLKKAIPDPNLSLEDGAIATWSGEGTTWERKYLKRFCEKNGIDLTKPWNKLSSKEQELILYYDKKDFTGLIPWFQWIEKKAYKMHVRVFLSRFRMQIECPSCLGKRLKKDALAYHINGKSLPDVWNMPMSVFQGWLKNISNKKIDNRELEDAISALSSRVEYLVDLGLPYLTLERQARTLSGGETQRVNLASALGSELTSTHFVLDEPSVGLHPRDSERLTSSIKKLTKKGNSLLVVEHDRDLILSADSVLELGPEAGKKGGEVSFQGSIKDWNTKSLEFKRPHLLLESETKSFIKIKNANARNLKNIEVTIPLGKLTCLIGVSGSGKSTLIQEVLAKEFESKNGNISGQESIESIQIVDQSSLAKSPRANIGTYSDIWEVIRDLLASTEGAQSRALSKSSFSFNVNAGRCLACSGAGFIREDMQFLSDVYVPCEVCLGKRFQTTVLEVEWQGKNVDDILRLSIDEGISFFKEYPKIVEPLILLSELGLGHLTIGHPLSELSGGESQRLKLVPFLRSSGKGKHLFIFDEPTTGLHIKDVEKLARLFLNLRNKGHTIVCVEHNLDLISCADWIIELGPEGGEEGGYKLFEGEYEKLLKSKTPTANYLSKNKTNKPFSGKSTFTPPQALTIKGAREHNLKDISVSVPFDKIVTLTGASGSGKSTIAKDIIFAEGQRQYLECLSPYARQFIKELKRPHIDSIQNLRPTICVHQHTFQPSKLSTVGTMSESYNFLRLLFSKVGIQHCPSHPSQAIVQSTSSDIAEEIKGKFNSNVRILAPIIKLKKGFHREIFNRAVSSEISEVRVDGVFISPRLVSYDLERNKAHSIDFVVAKCNPRNVDLEILTQSLDQALSLSGGAVIVHTGSEEIVFSSERACPTCKRGFLKPDPEDFSFSSKRGACKKCKGAGIDKAGKICKGCQGTRLGEVGRFVKLQNLTIHEAALQTPEAALLWLENLSLPSRFQVIASPVLLELKARLKTLVSVGLNEIPLNRGCNTLSGGELQRLRLASAMGSPLSGVMYIFDEPSIGLHPQDNEKILKELRELKERGNSVLIIEHDPATIKASEFVIDVGPSGGKNGGEIMFSGEISEFISSNSPTAVALTERVLVSNEKREFENSIKLTNGTLNNLNNFSITMPLQAMNVIAGVSGAGKSTLLHGIIASLLSGASKEQKEFSGAAGEIVSDLPIKDLVLIDQKPIGANSRSTPVSYLGMWDHIRSVFSETVEAKSKGYSASFFSYNAGKGRCTECKGLGFIKLEMSFLPDAVMECEVCLGRRYTEDAELIHFKNLSIADVLNLTFEEAKSIFTHHRKIYQPLHYACELGLGYLTLGQHANTVSGGESQRLKLVKELMAPERGHMVYLLDEPTTGLHRNDIKRLVHVLKSLTKRGHTVFIIEHDDYVIANGDFVVELGPGAGDKGGKCIFSGSPSELKKAKTPWGEILRH